MFAKENRYLSSSTCTSCADYEEQISILQQKLMQTHNKLIDQLDVCRQQQSTIIELTKKIINLQQGSFNQNSFEEQSFGINNQKGNLLRQQQKNTNKLPRNYVQFTLNNSQQPSQYNSPTFVQNRTQLLQSDLQAMRLKVLQQITQKNGLKEQLKQLKNKFRKEVLNYQRQIQELQNNHQHLLREYEYIGKNLQIFKTKGHSQGKDLNIYSKAEMVQLTQKCNQYERLYKLQVSLNQSQNMKFCELKQFYSAQKQKVKQYQVLLQKYSTSSKCNTSAECDKDYIQQNCITIRKTPGKLRQKSNRKEQIFTNLYQRQQLIPKKIAFNQVPKKQHFQNKQNILKDSTNIFVQKQNSSSSKIKRQIQNQKKQDYESTKQLIRKLEQAQSITRKKKRSQIACSN